MKRSFNVLLALGLLGIGVTAYACVLSGTVLCFKANDVVVSSWTHPAPSSFTTTVYADEDAWRFDNISVSRGGRNSESANNYTSWCVGLSYLGDGPATETAENWGFRVHYYNNNMGQNVTAWNGGTNTVNPASPGEEEAFYYFNASYVDRSSTSCN